MGATTIVHELGHMSGLPDNPSCPSPPGMMCSDDPEPPDSECDAMNTWATSKSAFFAR